METTKQVTFQILFTSDLHGSFRTYNYATCKEVDNGLSRIGTLMKRDRALFPGTTILCDCGDSIQGNGTGELVKSQRYKPFPLFSAMDALGYDFVVLGNHEFNFGLDNLYAMFDGYKGIKLCGNVFYDKGGAYLQGFRPYHIVAIPDGPRVAFIGMVSPNIAIWDKANVEKAGIHATDAATETQLIIRELKANNLADLFVAVEHMDEVSELNTPGSGATEIVNKNPELILFLGAHFHKIKGEKANQCVLSDSAKFAENLNNAASYGRVRITATCVDGVWEVIRKTGSYEESDVQTDIICPTPDVPEDEEVNTVTEAAHYWLSNHMQRSVVGWLPDAPLLPEPEIKGTHEGILKSNPLIHLVTRVMLRYSGADIAAAPLNAYTANCMHVPITAGGISQLYVYDNNTLYLVKMTGEQLLKWMEWSYAFFGTSLQPDTPAVHLDTDLTIPYGTRKVYLFDQFAGINYTVDLTKPVGQRIAITGMPGDKGFSPAYCYQVVTTNYRATTNLLMNSDDGIFKPGEKTAELVRMDIPSPGGEVNMLDMIAEYICEQTDRSIYAVSADNWEFVNLHWKQEWRDLAVRMINDGSIASFDHTRPVTIQQVQDALLKSKRQLFG